MRTDAAHFLYDMYYMGRKSECISLSDESAPDSSFTDEPVHCGAQPQRVASNGGQSGRAFFALISNIPPTCIGLEVLQRSRKRHGRQKQLRARLHVCNEVIYGARYMTAVPPLMFNTRRERN